MGKSTPKAPTPPDPYATAAAQGQMNKETAIANAYLNRINQYSPQGSLTFQQIGTNPDGTPQFSSNQTYSPEQQQLYESQTGVANSLSNLAGQNISRVQEAQSKPFSYEGMTPLQTSAYGGRIQGGYNRGGAINTGYDAGGQIQTGFDPGGQIQRQYAGGGDVQRQIGDAGGIQDTYGSGGDIQRGYGSGGNIQGGYDLGGNIQRDYASGGNIQRGLDYGGLQDIPGTGDFGAEAKRAQDAVYNQATSRLDPQFEQQQRALGAQLVGKGVSENSEAYRRAMDQFSRQKTDAYNQATYSSIGAGGQEQSRLFGLAMGARQQGVGERNTQGQFANQAQQQAEAQNAARAGFGNQAQQQSNYQNAALAQFGNQAQQQREQQEYQRAGFGNQAQQQAEQQAAARGEFANTAQQQRFGQEAARGQFANQAQQQAEQQSAAQADFGNQSQAQQNQQNALAATFGNQAQGAQNAQNAAAAAYGNQAQYQQNSQNAAQAAFANSAQQQRYQQSAGNATFNNQARQQQIQEAAYLRNLPLADIQALMGTGGGVTNPQFAGYQPVQQGGVDYAGMVQNNFSNQMQLYNQQLAQRNATTGAIFGLAGNAAMAFSDRRLKENIKRIGQLANGIATYAFKYINDATVRFGVMADEVLQIRPEAALKHPSGYLMVDYGKVW